MGKPPNIKRLMPHLLAARSKWRVPPPPDVCPEVPGPYQESVWDYPRPPEVRAAEALIRAYLGEILVLESARALRIVETAGAPVYYAPPDDWQQGVLVPNSQFSICEWKGIATQYDVVTSDLRSQGGAFAYHDPLMDLGQGYDQVAGWPSPHPAYLTCFLGDEPVRPQPGGLYAGWITSRVVGPFKGEPGTAHW